MAASWGIHGGAASPPGLQQPVARAGSARAPASAAWNPASSLFPRAALKANWQPLVLGCTQFLILSGGQGRMAEIWELAL